jgi:hypothetical protein
MRLENLLDIVETSSPDDWQRLPSPTFYRWGKEERQMRAGGV